MIRFPYVSTGDTPSGRASRLPRAQQVEPVHPRPASAIRQGFHAAVPCGELWFCMLGEIEK